MGVDDILTSCPWFEELQRESRHPIVANNGDAGPLLESESIYETVGETLEGIPLSVSVGKTYDIVTLRAEDFVRDGDKLIAGFMEDLEERIPGTTHPLHSIEIYLMDTPMSIAKQTYAPDEPQKWVFNEGVYSQEKQGIHVVFHHDIWDSEDPR